MEKFENFNELILALMLWITSNTNYITPKQTPNVEFIEQSKLSELACGNRECEIMAYTPIEPKYKIYIDSIVPTNSKFFFEIANSPEDTAKFSISEITT